MRLTTRLTATAAALALGVVGVVAGGSTSAATAAPAPATTPASAAPAYTPPALHWGACSDPTLQHDGAQCTMMTVPLDYGRPRGTTIQIAVSRVMHTVPMSEYQGVMLTNPGGPGGSGLTLSTLGQLVPGGVGGDYDWIGFDPRGVGSSIPSLSCDGDYFGFDRPDYRPFTPALTRAWFRKTSAYAAACGKAGGLLLDHVRTTDTVADMESLRVALGQQKISYYGFSYGTYLGQVYATLHPDRVRRFVLDSNVDPRGVWYQANLDQDVAFDEVMPYFWTWIAQHDSVYHLGTSASAIQKRWYAVLAQVTRAPADGGKIGPDEWTDAFLGAGYYVYGWADTASAYSRVVNDHDWKPLEALYVAANGATGPGADNEYAMYSATQCSDVSWPSSWARWAQDNWTIYGRHPFETWANAQYNQVCRYWPGASGTPVKVTGSTTLPGMLLIDETHDAATPYEGSLYIRSLFTRSVLVEGVGGTTHAGSLSGVACTDDTVAAYLATGALPARVSGDRSDKQCSPVPPPPATLTGSSSAQAQAQAAPSASDGALSALRRQLATVIR